MLTPVQKIYEIFLAQIGKDILAQLEQELAESLMLTYLMGATTMFNTCEKDLTIITDEFDESFINSELDLDEIFILVDGMLVYWLKPKIYTLDVIKMGVTNGDFSKKSTAPLLSRLMELKEMAEKDMRRRKVKYSYKNKRINE